MNTLYTKPKFNRDVDYFQDCIAHTIKFAPLPDFEKIQGYSEYLNHLNDRKMNLISIASGLYSSSYCNVIAAFLATIVSHHGVGIYNCLYYLKEMDLISNRDSIL